MPGQPAFPLRVLVTPRRDGKFEAHCLEFDLVAVADTYQEVKDDIHDVIAAHLARAMQDDDLEHLFHPAPRRYWALADRAEFRGAETIRLAVTARKSKRKNGTRLSVASRPRRVARRVEEYYTAIHG